MQTGDTIVAISSAIGERIARVIVRLSGPDSVRFTQSLLNSFEDSPGVSHRRLHFRVFPEFSVWIYSFKTPHSVTGEDIIELHLPGNALLAKLIVEELITLGARHAEPGEFTARGFFNGKLNLAQAEAVSSIVSASSQRQLDAARKILAGELATRLAPITDELTQALALVEAGIDFADEGIAFISPLELTARIETIQTALRKLLDESERFERLAHQPTVVLAGKPNAGKSTLLNALAGYDRAVVAPTAGTTRDALGANVPLPHGIVRVIDVAGIDAHEASPDSIDQQMRTTALRAIEQADVLLLLHDITDKSPPLKLSHAPTLLLLTKSDLPNDLASVLQHAGPPSMQISAHTRKGLPELVTKLDDHCFEQSAASSADALALTSRHVAAIEEALTSLDRAKTKSAPELLAADLRDALDSIGTILGQITPDDVLAKIFASFCIGK